MTKRNVIFSLILSGALALAGCNGADDAASRTGMPGGKAAELAQTSLLERDLEFAGAVAEYGLAEAYRLFLAEDAVQLPDGDWPVKGKDAIYKQILEATADSEFLLNWKPEAAEVSESGDLGYTWGVYWLELTDEEGEPVMFEGNYLNVWRKSPDSVWEVVVDISNQITTDYVASVLPENIEAEVIDKSNEEAPLPDAE